jgi:hypothetical protein
MTYILAMTLYPQWQIRLQEEVDRVCGDRMPEPKDSPKMPVLRAVIKEIMRWRPVTPSSIPHESIEDDVYEGYFIPKGTVAHCIRGMLADDKQVATFIHHSGQSPAIQWSIQIRKCSTLLDGSNHDIQHTKSL